MKLTHLLFVGILAASFSPIAIADTGSDSVQVTSLKKPTVRGKKDGKMTDIMSDELTFPISAKRKGPAYEIRLNGHVYKIRAMDLVVNVKQNCRLGEGIVVASTTTIGGSQMGNDALECD